MKKFAIFGENIFYSKSPLIHKLFFKQFNLNKNFYILKKCNIFNFKNRLYNFIYKKFSYGVNITVPFKEISYEYCDILTNNSYISKSVNTIKKISNNLLIGENTDGIGLISDLKRINFINKNNRILLIGSGGASRGIIKNLSENFKELILVNRTYNKAEKLKLHFENFGIKNIILNDINRIKNYDFDLIINATSSSFYKTVPEISNKIISNKVNCYDLFYNINEDTEFIKWCKINGSKNCSDGIGMLIYQAAYSFNFWNNLTPNVIKIFKKIKNKI